MTEQLARRAKEATNMTDEISALAALDRAGGWARCLHRCCTAGQGLRHGASYLLPFASLAPLICCACAKVASLPRHSRQPARGASLGCLADPVPVLRTPCCSLPPLPPVLCTAGGQLGASPGCVAARSTALQGFFDKWQSEPLVLLKWFALQVGACMVAAIYTAGWHVSQLSVFGWHQWQSKLLALPKWFALH